MKKTKLTQKHKKNLILINKSISYTRIAQLQQGVLSHFHLECLNVPSQVGSIYKARVIKKQEGLNVCFVDIGSGKSAFLYLSRNLCSPERQMAREKGAKKHEFFEEHAEQNPPKREIFQDTGGREACLKRLKKGQTLMVQVIKDPLKTKNVRVSDKISLPGPYLVYLPKVLFYIGASKQIEDEKLKEELIRYVREWNQKSSFVIRTRAREARPEDLIKDGEHLQSVWHHVREKYHSLPSPGLVWSDVSFPSQVLRDFLTEDVEKVLVDDEKLGDHIQQFVDREIPKERHKISFYNTEKEGLSLFNQYSLESKLGLLLNKKVDLKSGGFLVIEETEAAVVVDVNTGRFMGKKNPEETILKINLEAAKEIAIQMRLRNCGGIIFIDFIDMELERSRQAVMECLSQEFQKDRSSTRLFPMSELGVVQITRKRTRSSLLETLCEPCPHCNGLSYVKKPISW
ncbi:MAG: Rne/Rng family ribonuclease [Bdellovibrionales bacterium]|nr:Rne/Rng family ribonuclease [Bdellovibrionales bacterium]